MKILVPIDFSEASVNAAKVAVNIAIKTNSSILLFHSNHLPVITPHSPVQVYDQLLRDEEKHKIENLLSVKSQLQNWFNNKNNVDITVKVKSGFAGEEIINIANEEKMDLIVMGTTGAGGLKKLILGTIASDVIKKSNIPVLVVPVDYIFTDFKNIVLATDFKLEVLPDGIDLLQEFLHLYNAELRVLYVKEEPEFSPSYGQAEVGLQLEKKLKGIAHTYAFRSDENVPEAILEYCNNEKSNLLVMLPHQKNFIENLFGLSTTKEIAYSAKIPFLILPSPNIENKQK
jgi:nucleotide-binding universal stress UspA family protein